MTLFFEDDSPMGISKLLLRPKGHCISEWICSVNIQMPKFLWKYLTQFIESDENIVVQYSKMDTRLGGMALMTTLGYLVFDRSVKV